MNVKDREDEGVRTCYHNAAGREVVGGADAEEVACGGGVGDFNGWVDDAAVGGEPVGYLADVMA